MPPIATYQSTEDGKVTSKMLEYYGMRATGSNLATIITEHSYIDIRGKARKNQLSISSDEDIEGLKWLVDTIHQGGAKAIAQLNHASSAAPSDVTGERAVAPSSVILPVSPINDVIYGVKRRNKGAVARCRYVQQPLRGVLLFTPLPFRRGRRVLRRVPACAPFLFSRSR